jgi:hypothetical protein
MAMAALEVKVSRSGSLSAMNVAGTLRLACQ